MVRLLETNNWQPNTQHEARLFLLFTVSTTHRIAMATSCDRPLSQLIYSCWTIISLHAQSSGPISCNPPPFYCQLFEVKPPLLHAASREPPGYILKYSACSRHYRGIPLQ